MNRPVFFLAITCSHIVLATLTGTIALAQTNPVPLLNQPLFPTSVFAGHAAFTLKVTGTGFVPGSLVEWNGSPRATTLVSGKLQATISAG